ncbi:unnamed protein product [Sphagnum balticum]
MEQEEQNSRTTLAASPSEDSSSAIRKKRILLKAAQRKHKNASDNDENDYQAAAPGVMAPAVSALVDVGYISKALVPLHQGGDDSCLAEYIDNR